MPVTYTPIASVTISTNASVTFSSIPATYTDLRVVCSARSAITAATDDFCGLTTTFGPAVYSYTRIVGNGSTATSNGFTNGTVLVYGQIVGNNTTFGTYSTATIDFMNYSNTTTFKTILSRCSDTNIATNATVNLWRDTSAISTINLFPLGSPQQFQTGSTFTLYGIKAA
jgi:hypothetical protein